MHPDGTRRKVHMITTRESVRENQDHIIETEEITSAQDALAERDRERIRMSAGAAADGTRLRPNHTPDGPFGKATLLVILDERGERIIFTHRLNIGETHIFKNDDRGLVAYADQRFGFIAVYPEVYAMNFMIRDVKRKFIEGMVAVFRDVDTRANPATVNLFGICAIYEGGRIPIVDARGQASDGVAVIASGAYLHGPLAGELHHSLRGGKSLEEVNKMFSQPFVNLGPSVPYGDHSNEESGYYPVADREEREDHETIAPPPVPDQHRREQVYPARPAAVRHAEGPSQNRQTDGTHQPAANAINDVLSLKLTKPSERKIDLYCRSQTLFRDGVHYKEYVSNELFDIQTTRGWDRDKIVAIVATDSDRVAIVAQNEKDLFYACPPGKREQYALGLIGGAISQKSQALFFRGNGLARVRGLESSMFFVNFYGDNANKVKDFLRKNYDRFRQASRNEYDQGF